MTGRLAGARVRWRTIAPGARVASVLAVALEVGFAAAWHGAAAETPARPAATEAATETVTGTAALAGTERYCKGYDTTFHGVWEARANEDEVAGPPVLFRIGVNAGGEGCYAQLNVMTPPGVAPYELPRFGATAGDGGAWTLRYRETVLEVDAGNGTVVRRGGGIVTRTGVLRAEAPPIEAPPPTASAGQRERWYGKWRGRFPGVPFRIGLRFAASGAGGVRGRISSLLMAKTFEGWFHGEMLVFRWRNRHVGLVMDPKGDALVYTDYKGRVSRFRQVR